MPNWCENVIVVKGSHEELEELETFLKQGKEDFDFNLFIPYPKEYEELDSKAREMREQGVDWELIPKDGYNSGGYDWCIENWGTKWNAYEPSVRFVEDELLTIHFDTAWSPPTPIVEKMALMFPSLTFYLNYHEDGMGFLGSAIFANGEMIQQSESEY